MKRIDKIYTYVFEKCKDLSKDDLLSINGFSAQQIGEDLGILRNNVSKELNTLCRNKKLIKIKNRPVLYFSRECFEKILSINLSNDLEEITDISSFISLNKNEDEIETSPFDYLIGANTSLKNQIEQAKAALLYPPNGLHTLIIGSTGVGKSLFANIMYQYAKYIKNLPEDAPFIIFNCADYCNNPQLLLSHIFGHVKGAFTGADKEKEGIVEKADGGILFLDEIHRLPPEGQEMVFYFMDTGTYNKLGETDRNRNAKVLLIGATTEDPASTLLNTFIRRIPITIAIPNFDERSVEDKLKLVNYLISKEAQRVNKPIKITSDAIKALIGSTSYGNIGQLKSNIQLICAKGFLNSINSDNPIDINLKLLPTNIKNGIITFGNKIKDNDTLWNIIPNSITLQPNGKKIFLETDAYEPPFNIYNIIENKASLLEEEGMQDDDIKNFISTDINIHLKQFYAKFKNDTHSREGLLKIVDKEIIEFAQEIKILAENRLHKKLNERFIYAISLHLSALFNRINKKSPSISSDDYLPDSSNTAEYEVAKEIHKLIESRYNLTIPEIEIKYLTLLLNSIQDSSHQGKVGIIVAAHGTSTATSMVAVAKKLFDADNIAAIDMALERTPADILDSVIKKVTEIDEGKGVLLLVDMGSLNSFDEVIHEQTNICIRTIDMVSTPLVLEAVRKSSICDADLDSVYSYLIRDFRGYTNNINTDPIDSGVIVTICSTGKGAALKLKELVEDIIKNITTHNINVLPVGLQNLNQSIQEISKNNKIISLVGINDPNLGLPFVSIETLIDGSGEEILRNIIAGKDFTPSENNHSQIVLKNLCNQSLNEMLTFLNPNKVYSLLNEFISCLEKLLSREFSNTLKLRIMLHVACALERMVINDGLVYKGDTSTLDEFIFSSLVKSSLIFKDSLSITLSTDELYYMIDMLNEY
ncbi:sigma-54-dependent transcriptional regulator [Clostridium uliginosum]|uniref:Transcriptional regulatory protein LevR, contains PRD, AAA+ and EIIA domains n=1 Tax=Clostridium uliginosum TaxID=119641 RepID=A0A1I1P9E7_9CLOT|nr:sigma-54-dependent transcriptional regulator [Clostridium uliginosum]SFD06457.1 Transcriptional regulatory protein LevR, contains PRD, AAA+ and EIIA domains [Clostridium uliginosum]